MNKENDLKNCIEFYESGKTITEIAMFYCNLEAIPYNENVRKRISKWINDYKNTKVKKESKVLIYDIETSRMLANVWWTGKQYIGHQQLRDESRIITVAYKWLGDNKTYYLKWDNGCDKELVEKFLIEYNKADFVIGFNNKNFDDRFVQARAMKYGFEFNIFTKSLDIMKQCKKLFRIPSYSMDYIARYIGVPTKLKHSGIHMWEAIQYGTKSEAEKAMKEMIAYNVQDIIVTENVYLKLRKYFTPVTNLSSLINDNKICCPNCGSKEVELIKTTTTTTGTIQRIMQCSKDKTQFKISNSAYLKLIK